MNCGRSSSVEWKLPKLQRRVRFPSPAPAPPGHAPGGFVMPTSHPPSMRRDNRRNTFPARAGARGSGTKLTLHARHATSSGTKLAQLEVHGASSGTKLAQHARHATSPGTKLAQHTQNLPIWRVLCAQGEFCPATTNNKPGTPPVPIQNSPSSRCTVPVPVQNSPSTPKISQFGAFCSCWESFIPFLLPTSRAWRVFSRTNTSTTTGTKETTPPHNTQSHAMKDYPPTLHRQHHTMKYSSPQHATNNKNSPTFTMQGRTLFHNTHHTPTPGRHFFQPTPLPAKWTQTRPSSFSIASSLPGQTVRTSPMAARSQHDEAVH